MKNEATQQLTLMSVLTRLKERVARLQTTTEMVGQLNSNLRRESISEEIEIEKIDESVLTIAQLFDRVCYSIDKEIERINNFTQDSIEIIG